MALEVSPTGAIYAARQKDLVEEIKMQYPDIDNGLILFISNFENERFRFWQESSFYYYTGITEAGTVFIQDMENHSKLYIPNCSVSRELWIHSPLELTKENINKHGIDQLEMLGEKCKGYQLFPFFKKDSYQNVINRVQELIKNGGTIFTLAPDNEYQYVEQRLVLKQLSSFIPNLEKSIVNISDIVASMRRTKDMHEIDLLYKAVEITELSHEAAAQAISDNVLECEVQASLEYMMIGSAVRPAFPSIVASGKHTTTLHYNENKKMLQNGELVVVDIGAAYHGYCADITRTYPVSGKFTKRQREVYNMVLATQQYIAEIAKPGYYLNNPDEPEKSLHHLAVEFLKEKSLEKYFIHGIGHYLGLDVHDVGNPKEPLKENDVITIEPGIYIPEEKLGIRIEDDYWIVKNGAVCLSEHLPKKPEHIEELVRQKLRDRNDEGRFLGAHVIDGDDQEIEH